MKEIIYVDVERAICPMPPYIHMPRQSIREYSLMEPQIYRRKENKAQVLIAGKLIVATAIY